MTRINGTLVPARVRTPEDSSPARTSQAAATAAPARAAGFSGVSAFSGTAAAGGPSGPYGTAPSGAQKLSPNDLGVLAQDQGNTNACGTTSLANVLTYWGKPTTHQQVDESIRHFDLFSAPDKIVDYARDHGMRAELKADASLEDIAKNVDQGVPSIVLMDPDSDKNANLHYVTVSGYDRDASGKISDVVIADSAGGYRYKMPAAEFQQKWDNLKMEGVGTGLNNVMISVVPNDGRKITGGDGVTRSASDVQLPKSSFWSSVKSGPARGVADVISDVTTAADKAWTGLKSVASSVGHAAKSAWNKVKSWF